MLRSAGVRAPALLVAVGLAVACAPNVTAAVPAGPLKIGVLLPYTESAINGDIGAAQKKAVDLYLKQHGGKLAGRDVTFVWSDESVDPKIDQVKIRQLLDEKVEILLGGGGTEVAYALRDTAEATKIVYIDTNATANALTRAVTDCKPSCASKYVFRMSATTWQLSEPLGEWASKGGQKEFFLCYEDTAFGAESAAGFVEGLAKNGGKATGGNAVPPGTGEWATVIGAIRAQPTKNVFSVFLTDDAVAFLKAWDSMGMTAAGYRLYGPGPVTDQQVLSLSRKAAVGVITAQFWSSELDNPETKALVDAFRGEYTDEDTGGPLTPDAYAVQMWDTMRALDEALTKTKGDAKADVLIPALEGLSFKSPRGDYAFDRATHNPAQDIYICKVELSGGSAVNAVIAKIARVADRGR
jgi:branched-chain amino acid transport system substrate-binding protein